MKTLPLRELMRHPTTVKELTSKGQSVRITDNGKPLWVVAPDVSEAKNDEATERARQSWLDQYFEELEAETPLKGLTAAQVVMESRGKY